MTMDSGDDWIYVLSQQEEDAEAEHAATATATAGDENNEPPPKNQDDDEASAQPSTPDAQYGGGVAAQWSEEEEDDDDEEWSRYLSPEELEAEKRHLAYRRGLKEGERASKAFDRAARAGNDEAYMRGFRDGARMPPSDAFDRAVSDAYNRYGCYDYDYDYGCYDRYGFGYPGAGAYGAPAATTSGYGAGYASCCYYGEPYACRHVPGYQTTAAPPAAPALAAAASLSPLPQIRTYFYPAADQ